MDLLSEDGFNPIIINQERAKAYSPNIKMTRVLGLHLSLRGGGTYSLDCVGNSHRLDHRLHVMNPHDICAVKN